MAVTIITDSDYDPLFKKHYYKLADNLYNSYDNVYSQLPKVFGVGGVNGEHPVEVTFGGGVGSSNNGTLPEPENTSFLRPIYTPKRQYARIKIDNYTIEASQKTEHAFISAIDQETTGKLKSFNRNKARAFLNDGTGILGQFSGSAGGTAAAPTMTILTSGRYGRRKACFELGDYINVNSLSSVFRISNYTASSGLLTLARVNGSDDLTGIGAGTHSIYMQNSKDADPYGLLGIVNDSTFYGVSSQFRWSPPVTPIDAGGANLDTDMLTELAEGSATENDEGFTHFIFSPIQYRRYISLLEAQKRFPVPVDIKMTPNAMTSEKLVARVSFSGVKYMGSTGNIICMQNKFVRDDMIIGMNKNFVEVAHVKKPGWAQRDGTVFLRMNDLDAYEARYVSYDENRINPFYVSAITGLATS